MIVDNILGQSILIKHMSGTIFDRTFLLRTKALPSGTLSDFVLTDYDGEFVVSRTKGSTPLYSAMTGTDQLVFTSNSIHIVDNIDIPVVVPLYYHLKITSKTDPERIFIVWYGTFNNVK